MGWNSWNHFHDKVDDAAVRAQAEAMVSSGMRDAGYTYINIDDTWEGVRDSKGNRDRFVPLAKATHRLLQRFWQVHRNPVLLFPNRHGGLSGAASATTPLDRGGVQTTLHRVIGSCGLKKRSRPTACATATPPT